MAAYQRRALTILSFTSVMVVGWAPVRAAEVKVTLDERAMAYAAQAGVPPAQIEAQIGEELRNLFQVARVDEYLRSFADAHAFSSRGMGADYASNFGAVMLGASVNLSLNVEDAFAPEGTRTQAPLAGMAPNFTLLGGVNLAAFGLPPITVYGNYFDRSTRLDDFDLDIRNWGVHFQYKLFAPMGDALAGIIRWGGLDITTGLEQSRLGVTLAAPAFRRNIPRERPAGAPPGTTASVDVRTTGRYSLDMRMLNVPLEVTTNLRLLYALSVYGGFGLDWQLGGGSDLLIDLDGAMTGVVTQNGQEMRTDIGAAAVDATESVGPSVGRLRWLAGVQVNVLILKVFAQINIATADPVLASVALGARVGY